MAYDTHEDNQKVDSLLRNNISPIRPISLNINCNTGNIEESVVPLKPLNKSDNQGIFENEDITSHTAAAVETSSGISYSKNTNLQEENTTDNTSIELFNLFLCKIYPQKQCLTNYTSSNKIVINIYSKLLKLNDNFINTKYRQQIKLQVDSINLNNINFESFTSLIQSLFYDNYELNSVKLLVLFYFTCDLLDKCFTSCMLGLMNRVQVWWEMFLTSSFNDWVKCVGGWNKIFQNKYDSVLNFIESVGLGYIIATGVFVLGKYFIK